nr:transposase [Sulfobacillus thermosulfidooxidans]
MLAAEVTEYFQPRRYERTDERHGYRNGSRSRQLMMQVGTLTLEPLNPPMQRSLRNI